MARVHVELGPDDLEYHGGAYGMVELAGRTQAARDALDEITGATRRNGCRPRIVINIDYDDRETSVFAHRDAGSAGEALEEGGGGPAHDKHDEGGAQARTGKRTAKGGA